MWCVYSNREEKCDVRYNMVARFLDHNNLSWQRQHLHRQMMQERYRLYGLRWATVLFLSAIRHRNVIHVNFFLPYLQDHGLFSSRNFASKTKRRKQLFPSTSSKTTQMSTSAWGMPFLQYLPLPFSTKTTPTAHNSTQSLIIPLHQWCSCAHDHKYPQYRGTAVRMQCLVGTCCWPRSSLIYNMLFSIRTYLIQILILESHQNLKCHQWIWHELEWQQVFP